MKADERSPCEEKKIKQRIRITTALSHNNKYSDNEILALLPNSNYEGVIFCDEDFFCHRLEVFNVLNSLSPSYGRRLRER
jgi:hypothetical protein